MVDPKKMGIGVNLALTISLMDYVTIANSYGCHNEGVIVIFDWRSWLGTIFATYTIPRIFLDMYVRLFDMTIFRQEMIGQRKGEFFGRLDTKLLRQQIDGVLLRIGSHNVGIIAYKWEEIRIRIL